MKSKDASFIKLSHDEISSRISHLAVSHGEIKLWETGATSYLCKTLSFQREKKQELVLTIKNDQLPMAWKSKKILFQFVIREVNFFGQAVIESFSTGAIKIRFVDDVYKYEKRRSERLLAFPHHKIYVYFALDTKQNVSYFNRAKKHEVKVFENFSKEQMLNDDDSDGVLKGFRVIDISPAGVSFLANVAERSYFSDTQKEYDVIVGFNGSIVKSINAEIIYDIPYVNPRARKIPMFKLGMGFKESHPVLNHLIEEQLGDFIEENDINDEFETFIK